MSPWTWRHVWPVEDNTTSYREAQAFAAGELEHVLADEALVAVGPTRWEMRESDPDVWPHTELVLVAVVEVVPRAPTREQWPALIGWAQGQGWPDRRLASLLGLAVSTVSTYRRRLRRAA